MRISTLAAVPMPLVVETFLKAFEGYFVQLPTDLAYWEDRFRSAGVDLSRSHGAFDGEQLVAFIIHGIGTLNGASTAFNTGTGVLPAYRGRRLVDALYAEALPALRAAGIAQCTLEVITKNTVAIHVYQRIGFHVANEWKCFTGSLSTAASTDQLLPVDLHAVDLGSDRHYSWDNRVEALLCSAGRQQLLTLNGDFANGHVVLDLSTGRIARLGVPDEQDAGQWQRLLAAMAQVKTDVRLINVHPQRAALIGAVLEAGLVNRIDQYEMRMTLA
jgi:ribosomal protein S18 acetylase RimI-like enzyme